MKYNIVLLAIFCSSMMSLSFSSKMDFRPPGTVEVVDNFFYDEREICNIDWQEYLSFIKEEQGVESRAYQANLPDTTVWLEEGSYNEPLVETYFSHPAYNEYPVVGVTHKQARDYCAWRTAAVKTMMKANGIKGPKSFEYRLPSQTEWELIANAGLGEKSEKYYQKKLKKLRKKSTKNARVPLANLKLKEIESTNKDDLEAFRRGDLSIHIAPARSYLPNKFGVYHIYGNVAEMVIDPGIAMGGGFVHYYDEIVPKNKVVKYNEPQRWLGFRCVCEIIEK